MYLILSGTLIVSGGFPNANILFFSTQLRIYTYVFYIENLSTRTDQNNRRSRIKRVSGNWLFYFIRNTYARGRLEMNVARIFNTFAIHGKQ